MNNININNVNREYENLCYMAERMLDSIIKDSPNEQNIIFNVSFFIGGNAKIYKVESRPGSGHNVHAAIDSMYSYKKRILKFPLKNICLNH